MFVSIVVWVVVRLSYGVPHMLAIVLESWVLCYYHWPPEIFWHSDLPHGVPNVKAMTYLELISSTSFIRILL